MIPNKIIVTIVELLIRKLIKRYETEDGPSFKIIIISVLGMLGLMLTYNYNKFNDVSQLILIPDYSIERLVKDNIKSTQELGILKDHLTITILESEKLKIQYEELVKSLEKSPPLEESL